LEYPGAFRIKGGRKELQASSRAEHLIYRHKDSQQPPQTSFQTGTKVDTHSTKSLMVPEFGHNHSSRQPAAHQNQDLVKRSFSPSLETLPDVDWSHLIGSTLLCDGCDGALLGMHYHCSICNDDDFDLCDQCVNEGEHCLKVEHLMTQRLIPEQPEASYDTCKSVKISFHG